MSAKIEIILLSTITMKVIYFSGIESVIIHHSEFTPEVSRRTAVKQVVIACGNDIQFENVRELKNIVVTKYVPDAPQEGGKHEY